MKAVWLALNILLVAAGSTSGNSSQGLSTLELGIIIGVSVVVTAILGIWVAAIIIRRCRSDRQIQILKAKGVMKMRRQVFPIKQEKAIKGMDKSDRQECIICLDPIAEKEIRVNPCGHTEFHEKCFRQWVLSSQKLENREKCCRCTLPINSFSKYSKKSGVEINGSSMRPCNPQPESVEV